MFQSKTKIKQTFLLKGILLKVLLVHICTSALDATKGEDTTRYQLRYQLRCQLVLGTIMMSTHYTESV